MQNLIRVFLIFIGLLSVVYAAITEGDSSTINTAGQMVWVNGVVKATFPEQTPRVLARGSVIYEKDKIETAADGTGEIAFTDNSIVALHSNTTFIVEQYYFNDKAPTSGSQYIMNLIKGGFRTITGFVAKASPDNYKVKTPVATIGVRGTQYDVNCPGGTCAFALQSGIVRLENEAGVVTLDVDHRYATADSFKEMPKITNLQPPILQKLPEITPPTSATQPGRKAAGSGATSGNCGIVIQ